VRVCYVCLCVCQKGTHHQTTPTVLGFPCEKDYICIHVCVCVCVRERERRQSVCVLRVCVKMAHITKRHQQSLDFRGGKLHMYTCVCVCERERDREREREKQRTLCNTHCNTHCNVHCNTYCNTLQRTLQQWTPVETNTHT